ncbi:MAG: hypothetical protein NC416_18510 [Eubacterium sp.]|nr:hypothetical protein [Eubacterium sp.]
MSAKHNSSSAPSSSVKQKLSQNIRSVNTRRKKHRVDWHEAASCALQIELQEYSSFLEYQQEYILGSNSYRIDLLVIKKLTEKVIPKNIALIFKTFNLFEIKGIGSSASIDSYYKTIGYAGLLISQTGKPNQYSRYNISLTFLSCHYPRNLMRHLLLLQKENKIMIEKPAPGVYHINKETFTTQIIVTKELSADDNLYLHCLTDKLQDIDLANRLADDYMLHQEQDIYVRYMHQLTTANNKTKGESPMVCEGILNLCGTSSEEIIERTKKEEAEYYLPQIDQLSSRNNQLSSQVSGLSAQINYLKSLLAENNIPFDLGNAADTK